jgi:hypothetical protein
MKIPSKPELPPKSIPEIFVSFGWGDDSSEDAWKRTETPPVRRSGMMAGISRDGKVLRPGDLISGVMKRIGLADHVIVVLSVLAFKWIRVIFRSWKTHQHLQTNRIKRTKERHKNTDTPQMDWLALL